jgi:hypothetical protein
LRECFWQPEALVLRIQMQVASKTVVCAALSAAIFAAFSSDSGNLTGKIHHPWCNCSKPKKLM